MKYSKPEVAMNEFLAINTSLKMSEQDVIEALKASSSWFNDNVESVEQLAKSWVESLRQKRLSGLSLDAFFQQYKLSSAEGVALMCLAESLMRVPDAKNIDALITDKISSQDWLMQVGKSSSNLINASTFGLAVGGKVMQESQSPNIMLKMVSGITKKLGAPVLRQSIKQCMGILGKQFVMGETIAQALSRASKSEKYMYSYDMLGEAAKTAKDAEYYFQQYLAAINAIKESGLKHDMLHNPSISVKISALHPRYEYSSYDSCVQPIYDKLLVLAQAAKAANISLTLDAEESDRLVLSLMIFKKLLQAPELENWSGLGLAIQAYLKATSKTIDLLVDWANIFQKQIPLRLVKGAYWDTEIKDFQVRGLNSYPVFTRKVSTDVHYLLCAEKMLAAGSALYPQFATHNAFTVAMIWQKAQQLNFKDYEFQCLHGMGQTLYDDLIEKHPAMLCRNYAPVGRHAELLPYLVRRLLENGANTSFVNQILDENIALEELISNPFIAWSKLKEVTNSAIATASNLYGNSRTNSRGLNIQDDVEVEGLITKMSAYSLPAAVGVPKDHAATSFIGMSPADKNIKVTQVHLAGSDYVEHAYQSAAIAYLSWHKQSVSQRAEILRNAANLLEQNSHEVISLCIVEAGKTYQDAIDEVREAVDFLKYYASLAESSLSVRVCPGPTGEQNTWTPLGRGVVLCISPWNFPLAIFIGQVAAALVAGNTVLAKPASQTIAIADWAVQILYQAGLPKDVLFLTPGKRGDIGESLLNSEHLKAVMLTGSTATGKNMAQQLAARPGELIPLVAETGGQNVMLVDSTALPEQVVQDVVDSAFKSAGQRCSALRVLYVQDEIYDKITAMLVGAMAELRVGLSGDLATDVGPLIDQVAHKRMIEHEQHLSSISAKELARVVMSSGLNGNYFAPVAYEIDSISQLQGEVFGPILHIIRYKTAELDACLAEVQATGFGLTFGIHSRVESNINNIIAKMRIGNIYVNRNMVGAVVGVQPFGGDGLSGTGPKAGGPWYLTRLCREQTISVNTTAVGGNAQLMTLAGDDFQGYDLI